MDAIMLLSLVVMRCRRTARILSCQNPADHWLLWERFSWKRNENWLKFKKEERQIVASEMLPDAGHCLSPLLFVTFAGPHRSSRPAQIFNINSQFNVTVRYFFLFSTYFWKIIYVNESYNNSNVIRYLFTVSLEGVKFYHTSNTWEDLATSGFSQHFIQNLLLINDYSQAFPVENRDLNIKYS